MNQLQMLKMAMIAYVNSAKAVWSKVTHPLEIFSKKGRKLKDYRIYGNSIQDGTPTPEAPVEIQSVGELVTEGEHSGKYKVSVNVSFSDSGQIKKFDIYLDAPLRKLGEYADYVDFEKSVVVRKIRERILKNIDWWKQSDHKDQNSGITLYRYERGIDDKRLFIGGWGSKGIVLCSGLKNTVYNDWGIIDKTISERPNSAGSRNLRILTSQYDTVASMKEAFGDFKVYYILDDAYITEEKVTLPALPTFKGTTVYEVQTSTEPSGMEACYYE